VLSHIHHINFLVHDLNEAIQRYKNILGLDEVIIDSLQQRAVKTARFKIGESWLILVQPLDQDSVPAQHLAKHGEGFFLLSFGTDSLEQTGQKILSNGGQIDIDASREGLDGWRINDLNIQQFFGAQLQITEDGKQKTRK